MQSSESSEMYLETIYVLHLEKEKVQAVDIARKMGFSKPTISEWMNKLRKNGLVETNQGNITLTPEGEKTASKIYERHIAITEMLKGIGVSEKTAEEDACRIEHYISDETFDCLRRHIARVNPDAQKETNS